MADPVMWIIEAEAEAIGERQREIARTERPQCVYLTGGGFPCVTCKLPDSTSHGSCPAEAKEWLEAIRSQAAVDQAAAEATADDVFSIPDMTPLPWFAPAPCRN
jgi:hypothetical protein